MSDAPADIKRGLAGVVADSTAVSVVDTESGSLLYRGYPVPDLAATCTFEEVAYLIWHGELPDRPQLDHFVAAERERRPVPGPLLEVMAQLPLTCHPMDVLRTAVSFLGAHRFSRIFHSVSPRTARGSCRSARLQNRVEIRFNP